MTAFEIADRAARVMAVEALESIGLTDAAQSLRGITTVTDLDSAQAAWEALASAGRAVSAHLETLPFDDSHDRGVIASHVIGHCMSAVSGSRAPSPDASTPALIRRSMRPAIQQATEAAAKAEELVSALRESA